MTKKKAPEDKKPKGRPTDYTKELALRICGMIADGESLRNICKIDGMPDRSTVYDWLATYPEFSYQYAHAREEQADLYADEIIEIADTVEIGERITMSNEGTTVVREDMTAHRRIKIDARKWKAAKMAPKKYGDKLHTEHSGQIGVAEVKTGVMAMTALNAKREAARESLDSARPADA